MTTEKNRPNSLRTIVAICRIAFGLVLVVIGAILGGGGVLLAELGGSFYYVVAGILLVAAGVGFCFRKQFGFYLYAGAFILTLLWAIWEVGFNGWALTPRLTGPFVLMVIAVLL